MAERDELIQKIRAEAQRQGVDPSLIERMARQESGFNPDAVSPKGAIGVMQLMPDTARQLGVDPYDVDQNIRGGVTYFKQQLDRFKDPSLALAAYNAGPEAVQKYGGVPPYKETRGYIAAIQGGAKRVGEAVMGALTPASAEAAETKLPGGGLGITVTQRPPVAPDEAPRPQPVYRGTGTEAALMESIQARDPRTPMIDIGLEWMGKTRVDFGERFQNPRFVQYFYDAMMKKAEALDPTLNDTKSISDYVNVMRQAITDAQPKLPAAVDKPPPPPPSEPPPSEGEGILEKVGGVVLTGAGAVRDAWNSFTNSWTNYGPAADIITGQTSVPLGQQGPPAPPMPRDLNRYMTNAGLGAFVDPLTAGLDYLVDTKTMADRKLSDFVQTYEPTAERLAPPPVTRPGATIKQYMDDLLLKGGEAAPGEELVRGLAGFLIPFAALSKSKLLDIPAMKGTGRIARGVNASLSGAAEGAVVDYALTDPDSPFFMDLIHTWIPKIFPTNSAEMLGVVDRYLKGELSHDELTMRFAKRGLRAGEGTVTGVLAAGLLGSLKFLATNKVTKALMGYPPNQAIDPNVPPPPPAVAQQRVLTEAAQQDVEYVSQQIRTTAVDAARPEASGAAVVSPDRLPPAAYAEGLRVMDEIRINPAAPQTLDDVTAYLRSTPATGPEATVIRQHLTETQRRIESGTPSDPGMDAAVDLALVSRMEQIRAGSASVPNEYTRIMQDVADIQRGVSAQQVIERRYGAEAADTLTRVLEPVRPTPPAPTPPPAPVVERGINPLTGEQLMIERGRVTPPPSAEEAAAEALGGVQRPTATRRVAPGTGELSVDQMERAQVLVEELRANPDNIMSRRDAAAWLDETVQQKTPLAESFRTEIESLTQYKGEAPTPGEGLVPRGAAVPATVTQGETARLAAEMTERARLSAAPTRQFGEVRDVTTPPPEPPTALETQIERAVQALPPAPQGTVRLYRGETAAPPTPIPAWIQESEGYQATRAATGRWYTDDPTQVGWYLKDAPPPARLRYLDVPADVAEAAQLAKQPAEVQRFSANRGPEFFLPPEYAGKGHIVDLSGQPGPAPAAAAIEPPSPERATTLQRIQRRNDAVSILQRDTVRLGEAFDLYDSISRRVPEGPGLATLDAVDGYIRTERGLGLEPPYAPRGPRGASIDAQDGYERSAKLLADVDKPAAESGMTDTVKGVVKTVKDAIKDPTVQRLVMAAVLRGTIGGLATYQLYDPEYAAADTPEEREHKRAAGMIAVALGALGFAVVGSRAAYRYIKSGKAAIDATGRLTPDVAPRTATAVAAGPSVAADVVTPPPTRGPWVTTAEATEMARTHSTLRPTEITMASTMPIDELSRRRIAAVDALDKAHEVGKSPAEISRAGLESRAQMYTALEQRALGSTPPPPAPAPTPTPPPGAPPTPPTGGAPGKKGAVPWLVEHLTPTGAQKRQLKELRATRKQATISFAIGEGEAYERLRANTDFTSDPDDFLLSLDALDNAVPETQIAREAFLNFSVREQESTARALGLTKSGLADLVKGASDPIAYSMRTMGSAIAVNDAMQKLFIVGDEIKRLGGIDSGNVPPKMADAFTRLLNVAATWRRAVLMQGSDAARTLNLFKQMKDGYLGKILSEGQMAGSLSASRNSIDDIIEHMDNLRAGTGNPAEYLGKIANTSAWRAIEGAYIESVLGSFATPVKAAVTTLDGTVLLPLRHFGAALASYVPGMGGKAHREMAQKGLITDPTKLPTQLIEPLLMWGNLATNLVRLNTIQKGVDAFLTGNTPHIAGGRTMTRHVGPAITAQGFQNVPVVGNILKRYPNAANVVDAIGSFSHFYGTRILNSVSEMSQFAIQEMEKTAYAYRAAMSMIEQGAFTKGSEEYTQFMSDFMHQPPESVQRSIEKTSMEVDLMNDLFDDTASFANFRKMIGMVQTGMDFVPILRISEPFLRTMTNAFTSSLDMTPLGPINSLFRHDFTHPDPAIRAAAQGKAFVAGSILALFGTWGAMGISRGPLTTDPDLKAQYDKAGYAPNSITLPGTNTTIRMNPTQPFGFAITAASAIGAYAYTWWGETSSSQAEQRAGMAVFSAFYELMKNELYMKLFGEIWRKTPEQWEDEGEKAAKLNQGSLEWWGATLDDILFSHFPSRYLKEAEAMISPYKQVYDTAWEEWKTRIPGLSDSLKTETDVFGRKRLPGGGLSAKSLNNAAHVLAGTGFKYDEPDDPMDKAMADKGIVLHDPQPVFSLPGTEITTPLFPSEQQRLREIIAFPDGAPHSFKEEIERIIATPEWKDATKAQANVIIRAAYRMYTTAARAQMWEENTVMTANIRARLAQQGAKDKMLDVESLQEFQQVQQERLQLRLR